jgi:lipoate-protein ligase A
MAKHPEPYCRSCNDVFFVVFFVFRELFDLTKSVQVLEVSIRTLASTMTTMGMMRMLLLRPTGTVSTTLTAARRSLSTTSTSTSSTTSSSNTNNKIPVSWLDLRGSGLSVLERLLLEECLVRHDTEQRSWIIAGTHEPVRHRYLRTKNPSYASAIEQADKTDGPNHAAVIVMGIGGKPEKLLNIQSVLTVNVLVLKRFTGGGTVVLDSDSIWTTMIGRPHHFTKDITESFPKPIMQYTANAVFGPLFRRLKVKQQQVLQSQQKQEQEQGPNIVTTTQFLQMNKRGPKQTMVLDNTPGEEGVENSGRTVQVVTLPVEESDSDDSVDDSQQDHSIPDFSLVENDYCLGHRKMGGNAQSIVKGGWLHHTSFLWDYDKDNMDDYLTLPDKRPDYRKDRPHNDFLCKLREVYPDLKKGDFYDALKHTASEEYEVETVTVRQALEVVKQQAGGMQEWFEKGGRTRVVKDLLK